MPNGNSAPSGNHLRDFRVAKLWTQAELAKRSKVSVWVISQTERGKHMPGPLSQERLARAFGVPRDAVFPRDKQEVTS